MPVEYVPASQAAHVDAARRVSVCIVTSAAGHRKELRACGAHVKQLRRRMRGLG